MASSYVNDLRLNEMATGDASGSWGTNTNTNLSLIGEALGYGTEGITTNADTHTTTVADGATDPGRAMYIEYTGTLDSACTITIAPNTLSRMHFIENGTSGSQNIIIKQGSGATITIPPGDTKAVYLDGAGSGAKVVDAFASLNVVDLKVQDDLTVTDDLIVGGDIDLEGAIDVNGTANLDVVDIDGAVDMASTLAVAGVVTANAGVVVDNITIDGTEIDLSSGDLTLDVAGSIIFDADGADYFFKNGGTEVLRISGDATPANVTMRVMPSDGDFVIKGNDGGSTITALTLDMSAAGAATFNSTGTFGGDLFVTGGQIHTGNTAGDHSEFGTDGSGHTFIDASTSGGAIFFQEAGTTAVTITSGNVKIGDTSTDVTSKLTVSGNASEHVATFMYDGSAGTYFDIDCAGANGAVALRADARSGSFPPLQFWTGNAERMRLTNGGALLVGTTDAGSATHFRVAGTHTNDNVGVARFSSQGGDDLSATCISIDKAANNSTTSQIFVRFGIDGFSGGCGQINASGGGAVAFGSFSDRRLKENITDLPLQLENILALQPKEFDYIESEGGGHNLGFIAQEVELIYPDLVGERKDGMKTLSGMGKMEARLIKAIQEQQTIIEDLKTRIETLEG